MMMVDRIDIVKVPLTLNEMVAGLAAELVLLCATVRGVKWVILMACDFSNTHDQHVSRENVIDRGIANLNSDIHARTAVITNFVDLAYIQGDQEL
eukprot:scaffold16330_cov172-Amphora_coffeaeformis.AAC.4